MVENSGPRVTGSQLARSWSRIDGVDCLRALAIFYVLMNHINMQLLGSKPPYYAGWPHALVTALVWQGQVGVQIFFAVSGFLITSTSIRRWGSLAAVRPRHFYLIRFARIAPLLLTLLVVLSILHGLHLRHFVVSAQTGGLRGALLAALTLRIGLLEATRGYLPGNWDILWSLSVEEMFYLFFPLACLLLGSGSYNSIISRFTPAKTPDAPGLASETWVSMRQNSLRKEPWLVLLLFAFVVVGPFARTIFTHGNEVWKEYSYLGGMDAIAMGCLTAMFVARHSLSRGVVRLLVAGGLALLIFCLAFSEVLWRLGIERLGLGMTLVGIGACMLIAAAAESRWRVARIFTPVLAYGRRSYEVYLTHEFVLFLFTDWFKRAGRPMRMIPLLFVVCILAAGLLGELVARYYSEPANRLLRARFRDGPKTLGSVMDAPAQPG